MDQARSRARGFRESNQAKLRAYEFINNKPTILELLPPTVDAFLHHLKRAALAAAIDNVLTLRSQRFHHMKNMVGKLSQVDLFLLCLLFLSGQSQ